VTAVDASIDEWDPLTEEGAPAGIPTQAAWSKTLANFAGGNAGTNGQAAALRMVVPAADQTASGNKVRLTLTNLAGAPDVPLDAVAIVERSGATSDGTTTPTQVTFGGAAGITVAAGETVVSDWIGYTFAAATDHLVALDIDPSNTGLKLAKDGTMYVAAGTSAGVAVMPTNSPGTYWLLLAEIEVQ
jgi:hypothetical protein